MENNIRYSTATATTAVPKAFTLDDILKAKQKIDAMPKGKWVLVAPDGRMWADEDPKAVAMTLALECDPLKF